MFDAWSIVHFSFGVALGLILAPGIAAAVLVIWEPVEIFILSPLLARFGIVFGYESLRNSLSDIVFDIIGLLVGTLVLPHLISLI